VSVRERAANAVVRPVGERLQGNRPGPVGAAAGATVAGAMTGLMVYRLLRRGADES
jgi:hypothetical protein